MVPDSVAFIDFPETWQAQSQPGWLPADVQLCHFISPDLTIYFNLWLKMHVKPDHETIRKLELLALSLVSHLSAFYAANGPVLVPKPVICAYFPATGQIRTQLFSPLHIQDCLRCQHSNKIGSPAPANGLEWPILRFSISPWTTLFFPNRFRVLNLEHLDVILDQNFKIGPQNANNSYCKFTYRPPTNY